MKAQVSILLLSLASLLVAQPGASVTPVAYGARARFTQGTFGYPDLNLSFLKREESRAFGNGVLGVSYLFKAREKSGPAEVEFTFRMSGIYWSTLTFELGGKRYVAEMFETLSGPDQTKGSAIPHDEIIVWDEAAARKSNPRILPNWAVASGAGK